MIQILISLLTLTFPFESYIFGKRKGIKKSIPKFGNGKGMQKSIPIIKERESEAIILGNGREREFPLTSVVTSISSSVDELLSSSGDLVFGLV